MGVMVHSQRMRALPTSFGKYFLTDKLATGGMAEIYLAKLIGPGGFEKQLVIKQIHPELSGQPQFVDMFVAEAKTLVGLSHGNIVPVYELGVVDSTYFIAMEYIDGPTLDRLHEALMHRGAVMEPALAAYVCAKILEGLDYAHRKGEGLIHRDLSPRNVMLSREGEVKLVDFGIAVPLGQDAGPASQTSPVSKMPAGSYPYMSPEQVRGQPLTGQSDLFSAGALLWEMLAGKRLFARASAEDTLAAVTAAVIEPPSVHRPSVPAMLDAMCLRALERDPARRYPSAAAWLAEVHRYLYSLAEPVSAVTLSALVARYCPPEIRADADHGGDEQDSPAGDELAEAPGQEHGASTRPLPRATVDQAPDRTRPLPGREPAAQPAARGKAGARAERTFATHVELERVLRAAQGTTPPASLPVPADRQAAVVAMADTTDTLAARQGKPGWRAGSWSFLGPFPRPVLAALVCALLAATGVVLARHADERQRATSQTADQAAAHAPNREREIGLAPMPPGARSEPAGLPDTSASQGQQSGQPAAREPEPGAAPGRLTPARGPGSKPSRPSLPAGRTNPALPPRTEQPGAQQAAGQPALPGTLKVGANPWGEVYLDGQKLGRAPNAWSVPAGAHRIEVTFPLGERIHRRSFSVTITPGQTASLGIVDFTDALAGDTPTGQAPAVLTEPDAPP